jgi:hypothetical protein
MRKTLVAAALAVVAVLGTAGTASASDSDAVGVANDSPGILSGNVIQVPINIPINVCGNNILALLTLTEGTVCINK